MLIIDPEVNCARIYTEDYSTTIVGKPNEVCEDLAKRLLVWTKNEEVVQPIVPSIVKGGVGKVYVDLLENMGVTVKTISYKYIGVFLPELT